MKSPPPAGGSSETQETDDGIDPGEGGSVPQVSTNAPTATPPRPLITESKPRITTLSTTTTIQNATG